MFPEAAETQPELLAYHFAEAGLAEPAIVYWRKAGQRAAKRAANIEAIDHFRRGLSLLDAMPTRTAHADEELGILLALGPALMSTRTTAAPEIQEVYSRARRLAYDGGRVAELFATVWGSSLIAVIGGNHQVARACAAELFSIARKQNDAGYLLQAHHAAWAMEQPIGNFNAGRMSTSWRACRSMTKTCTGITLFSMAATTRRFAPIVSTRVCYRCSVSPTARLRNSTRDWR